MSTQESPAENDAAPHPHAETVRAYLDNAGITSATLRYVTGHEALCRSWIFDLLTGLADVMEADTRVTPPSNRR